MLTKELRNLLLTGRPFATVARQRIVTKIWRTFGWGLASLVAVAGLGIVANVSRAGIFQADDDRQRVTTPNFRQAEQYSSTYLRQFVYSTSVTPNWIDKTDEFWYSYKTAAGTKYWRVNPENGTRLPLFDHVKLAGQLSTLSRQAVEPNQLSLTRLEVSAKDDNLKFVVEQIQYEYALKSQELKKLGPAPPAPFGGGRRPPGQREQQDQQQQDQQQDQRQQDQQQDRQQEERQQEERQQEERQQEEQRDNEQRRERGQQERGERPGDANPPGPNDAHRNFSPDRKSYVFAKGHNLYLVRVPEEPTPTTEPPKTDPPPALTEQTNEVIKEEIKEETKEETKDGTKVEIKEGTEVDGPRLEPNEASSTGFWNLRQASAQESQTQETQTQTQETQTQETNQEQGKQEEVKQEETKQEQEKQVEKQEETKQEQVQQEEVKQDEIKQEEIKQEHEKQEETKQEEVKQDGQQQNTETTEQKTQESEKPVDEATAGPKVDPKWDELAVQITTDGADKYSFAGRSGRRGAPQEIKEDALSRPNITWSKDSQKFYVSRSDSRGVNDLWVINSLATPRPALETYSYPMPGEEAVRKSELYWFQLGQTALTRIAPRWKDEFYSDIRFSETHDSIRFLRRDRLLRNVEYCALELANGQIKSIFEEGFEKSTIAPKAIRFLKNNEEMIWWSERSGWGHFYLYDNQGQLKNAITSGTFFADRLVDLDEENRILYFTALGREPGENLNYSHLYSIRLDGGDLKLLNPGDANHTAILSPSKKYLVDNFSRVDLAPCSVLRNSDGVEVLKLEECDLSRLEQVGFRMPETFVVKASDGVTDLFGNMYKPFNFDPNKKYPIITYVYPGPQQEGTRHTFTATAGEQQLAQIGFIVIQVGHRGGTPGRSKAYASYGYFNLRDYALADKKAAIEQLAQRFPYIDIERVGMYGHSGGGFMTAAALMVPPYNDFFKAGFSTAGNHDNNIYNNSWSERWHGLREVPVEQTADSGTNRQTERGQSQSGPSDLQAILDVQPEDFFFDYEMATDEDPWSFEQRLWGDHEPLPLWLQEEQQEQQKQEQEQQEQQQQQQQQVQQEQTEQQAGRDQQRRRGRGRGSRQGEQQEQTENQLNDEKQQDEQVDGQKQEEQGKQENQESKAEQKTRFEIKVPTNAELAANLKHHLFLVHGELDNNVHPANTLRLVDALIKANKKFDMLYLPGTRHGFGAYQPYVTQRMFEFFADRLMLDYETK